MQWCFQVLCTGSQELLLRIYNKYLGMKAKCSENQVGVNSTPPTPPTPPHPAHQLIYCLCLFETEVNCRSWHASIFVCLAPSTPLSPAMSGQFPFYILFLLFLILHSSVENPACDMFWRIRWAVAVGFTWEKVTWTFATGEIPSVILSLPSKQS